MTLLPVHEQLREDQRLGAAWRRCENALPEGWRPVTVYADDDDWSLWQAATCSPSFFEGEDDGTADQIDGFGPTPTAALEALAECLEALP